MISVLSDMMSYTFIVRAMIVGGLVALCSALLGVSLVLKRYSMIGDGLSHVAFAALTIAVAMNVAPLYISTPIVTVAAIILLRLSENSKIKGDSAIALISTVSIAIGVVVTALTKGMNTDVYSYMFGSILAMSKDDVVISVCLSAVVIVMFIFCYHKIFAVTFDENFSKATGVKVGNYNTLISIFTAITVVIGIKMMGAMLISSLIIFPALTSMRIFKSFISVTICSAILAVINFTIGLICSYVFSIPAGASVVVVNLAVFIIFGVVSAVKKRV